MTNEVINDKITVILEDDTELECQILTILEVEEQDYIALLPMSTLDDEESDVFLYRYSEDEDENPVLDNIETDEEYEKVCEAFDEWLDEQEYDEIVSEEEAGL